MHLILPFPVKQFEVEFVAFTEINTNSFNPSKVGRRLFLERSGNGTLFQLLKTSDHIDTTMKFVHVLIAVFTLT